MGLKKNVFYSGALTALSYLFPLITYPYISRVIGASGVGICSFTDSVVNYFVLFSSMGIGTLGVREIAKCNGNKEELSRVFSSLFLLSFCTMLIALAVYLVFGHFNSKMASEPRMLYIGALKIITTPFLIEWFYRGVENFKYITIRSFFVRLVYVVLVFVFIKKPEDYYLYFFFTTLTFVANSIFNFLYRSKFCNLQLSLSSRIREYLSPYFIYGIYTLLTAMYTSFNVVYLGMVGSNEDVGYYSSATKLLGFSIAFFSAFTNVVMPRMSSLLSLNDKEKANRLINISFSLLYLIAMPMMAYLMYYAPQVVRIISGPGFEGAIIPFRIVMPLFLITGIEQILIVQLLMPLNKDKAVLFNSIMGAIVGIVFNIVLVSRFVAIGSAFVWLISEITVMLSAIYFIRKYIPSVIRVSRLLRHSLVIVPLVLVYFLFDCVDLSYSVRLSLAFICTVIIVVLYQRFFVKDGCMAIIFKGFSVKLPVKS